MIKELETIVLSRDLPEHGLSRGDIGAVVHSYKSGESYMRLNLLLVEAKPLLFW
jgi:hypothetical protein